jgi:hypothetical protein
MSQRDKHEFQFTGKQIGDAAKAEYEYHGNRVIFWKKEQRDAIDKAKALGLEVSEYQVTGGVHAQMVINPTLQARINECANKIQTHQRAADAFQIEAAAYGTQAERVYQLHADDVIYFRLAGSHRPE